MYFYANGNKQNIYNENASNYTLVNGGIRFPISDINDVPTFSIGIHSQNNSNTSYFKNLVIEMEQLSSRAVTTDLINSDILINGQTSLSFSNDKLVLSGLPSDHTETIIEKKDGASVNVGKATDIIPSEPGEYRAVIKSASSWTFTEYVSQFNPPSISVCWWS